MTRQRSCVICKKPLSGRQRSTCGDACRKAKSRGRGPQLTKETIQRPDTNRKGQCVPIAICAITGLPFELVLSYLMDERKKLGNRDVAGFWEREYVPVIERLGFVEIVAQAGVILDQAIAAKGDFLAKSSHHLFAVRDGRYLEVPHHVHKYRRRVRRLWVRKKKCVTVGEARSA